jgi:transposase
MPNLKEIFRLKQDGYSNRAIHRSTGVARATIAEYLDRASQAGLTIPQALLLTQDELEHRLFPQPSEGRQAIPSDLDRPLEPGDQGPLPDWEKVYQELHREGVTRQLLWEEYRELHPNGLGYSQYCDRYNRWRKWHKVTAHVPHPAGESMEVDYAGPKVKITDPQTGEIHEESVFVAVLPASDFTYTELHPEQSQPYWIGGHTRALEAFGGVPRIVRPDNLKAGVKSPCRYEPVINPTYQAWATHYDVAVLPTRVRTPKDKPSVENGVLNVERQVLARMRNETFYGRAAAITALREFTAALNDRPRTDWPGKVSRRQLLESLERPCLRPLPAQPFEYAEHKKAKVGPDYHVADKYQHYSVPWKLAGNVVEMRISQDLVEIFHRGERVAVHPRRYGFPGYSTLPEHMPENHRAFLEGSLKGVLERSQAMGPAVAGYLQRIVVTRTYPEQAYAACRGVLSLTRRYSVVQMEAACERLTRWNRFGYRVLRDELKKDRPEPVPAVAPMPAHEQVRGSAYYAEEENDVEPTFDGPVDPSAATGLPRRIAGAAGKSGCVCAASV